MVSFPDQSRQFKNILIITTGLLLLSAGAASSASWAQTVEGRIMDQQTEEPLAGVNILVEGSDTGSSSDENGRFTVNVGAGSVVLLFSFVGYEQKEVIAQSGDQLTIFMTPDTQQLDELVVTDQTRTSFDQISKLDVPAYEIPVTTGTVSADMIEARAVDDITEALRSVSGIRPVETYGGFQSYTIRGFSDFVMLTDHVRDERHNISQSAPSTNLANVERIEVLKGPASVLYGHSALGGIINVVRKQPTPFLTGGFSASLGSFNSTRIQAGAGGPVEVNLRYRFDFGSSQTDGWRNLGRSRNSAYAALDYEPAEHTRVQFQFGYNNDMYDTDAGIPLNADGYIPDDIAYSTRYNHPDSYLAHRRYDVQLRVEHQLRENLVLSNRISWSDDDIDYSATEGLAYNDSFDFIERTFHLYFNHQTRPLQNQLEAEFSTELAGTELRMLAGYSLSVLDRKTFQGDIGYQEGYSDWMSAADPNPSQGYVDVTAVAVQHRDETAHGFYLQNWLKPTESFRLLLGVRYDHMDGDYYTDQIDSDRNVTSPGERSSRTSSAMTWRLGSVFDLADWLSLYGSYSTYFKPSRTFTYDNRVFNPETGFQGEAGIRLFPQASVTLTAAGFYIQKNDMVIQTGLSSEGQPVHEQVGMADSRGVEIDLNMNPAPGFSVQAGYNYTDARYRDYETDDPDASIEGNRLRLAPEHQFNTWVSYTVNIGRGGGLTFGLGGHHVGENFTNDQNDILLPAYTVVEGSIGYRFSRFSLALNMKNILNETYFVDAILTNQVYPGPPRNMQVTLRMNL